MNFSYEHLISRYWTSIGTVLKVTFIMKKFTCVLAATLGLLLTTSTQAGQVGAVSADDAQTAVAHGAIVVDLRPASDFSLGHLPQAVSLPPDAAHLPLPRLAALLSQAGVDTSRSVLVVGEAGDANAQALWQRLTQVASGHVLWLVGGVPEWQMRGYALTSAVATRPAVPQFLTPFDAPASASRMAGGRVRTSALLERSLATALALN